MPIPWEWKGPRRNLWGLLAHAVGGGLITLAVYGLSRDVFDFPHVILSVMLSVTAGLLWELAGWAVMGWPANQLDLLPWPLGSLAVGIAILAGLGA